MFDWRKGPSDKSRIQSLGGGQEPRTDGPARGARLTRTGSRDLVSSPESVSEGLAAEERLLKLSRLRRGQSRLREYVHNLIRELPLFCRKHRRIAAPTQTSANVLVEPRFLTRDLIREPMQVPDLIEQRLKLFVGDRHDGRVRPPSDESFLTSPLVLLQEHGAQFGESSGRIVEGARENCSRSAIVSANAVRPALRLLRTDV